MSLEDAKALIQETEGYGVLHIEPVEEGKTNVTGLTFYSEESPSITIISSLESKIQRELTLQNRLKEGIDVEKLNASVVHININQESFEGEKTSKMDSVVKLIFGGAAGYLLFMFIIILMTVASLILGVDVAQMQTPQQQLMEQAMENPEVNMELQNMFAAFFNLPLANLILAFIFFFIGGYLLYSSLYAAIGAAVDNETDTQQFMLPIIMPLVLAVYIGIFTVIEDPHGSFVLTVWFAAKIYRVGILMYGKKPSYKELIKWIKY